jgi:hypothetical protein
MRYHRPLAIAVALAACGAPRGAAPPLVDVDASLTPLHAWFDAHAGEPRVILLLSPV